MNASITAIGRRLYCKVDHNNSLEPKSIQATFIDR